jgi:aspartokinase
LTKTEDELFAGLHVKNRNVIRKAIKEGVIIKEGSEYLNVCADLIKLTMVRQGIKFYVNLEDLQRMQAHLRDEIKFYIAYKDDIAQGCAVIVYRKGDAAYYLHGGSIEHPFNGSVNLIQCRQ